jgi:hypothetical protein
VHVLGVTLGNGWYNQPRVAKYTKAAPKMLMRLSVKMVDGTSMDVVSTDDAAIGWLQHASPVVMDDIYNGETYNATMETAHWTRYSILYSIPYSIHYAPHTDSTLDQVQYTIQHTLGVHSIPYSIH